jgi:tetratricopeptide (TPR) repeat protein
MIIFFKPSKYIKSENNSMTLLKAGASATSLRKASQQVFMILAVLICTALLISGCSDSKLSGSPTAAPTATAEATLEATATPAAQPTAGATTGTAAEATPAATAKAVQVLSIAAASEELTAKGYEEYNQYNYDDAISYFDKAISADNNNYMAYTGKGITLCFKGQYSAGMPLIQKAIDLKPDYAYSYYSMAMAYKLQKDYDNSLIYFNKSLTYDPKDTWSYYGIATIYADRKDINTSLDYLKKAIALDPAVKDVAKQQDHFQPYLNNEEFMKLVN